MKIAVLIKQVPLNTEITFNADDTLDRASCVKGMNPADKCALLHAISSAKEGDSVIALSMGPQSAGDMLREAIAFGAHEAILLEDRSFAGSDTYATSGILAAALRLVEPQLVLCGRRAVDGETGQIGPQLAVRLGMSCLTNVTGFHCRDGKITAKRLLSDQMETVEASLPAVVSVMESLDVTALPSIAGLRRARSAEIQCWDRETLGLEKELCGLRGSKTRVIQRYVSEAGLRHPLRIDSSEEGTEAILARLKAL